MRRLIYVGVALLFSGGVSCFDARTPTGPDDSVLRLVTTASECTVPTQAELADLADLAFQTSPSPSSVKGQLNGVYSATTPEATKAAALKVIEFIFKQFRDNHGSYLDETKVTEFFNALSCKGGLNVQFDNPHDAWVVYDDDVEKTFITNDGKAGIKVPAGATNELTLIAIVPVGWTGNPGTGPLATLLDQYSGFKKYMKSTPAQFNSPALISLCIEGVPLSELEFLRIGKHAPGEGDFEILPPPAPEEPDDIPLNCGDAPSADLRAQQGVAGDMIAFNTGGLKVSGSTRTFTTMGGVVARGCVSPSCTPSTFSPIDWGMVVSMNPAIQTTCAAFPVNSQVPAACRPSIPVVTPLGTRLNDVPVDFVVTSGGGQVAKFGAALAQPDCVQPFGGSVEVPTHLGVSTACWTLGALPGLNTVRATPRPGGDAPEGIVFTDESGEEIEYVDFSVNATVDFVGFFSPIQNIPGVNSVKAGNSVPIKFSLGGAFPATGIFEAGYPRSVQINCLSNEVIPNTEIFSGTSGGSSLNYSTTTGQYTYSWKTEKSWTGMCRQLELKFSHDPTGVHSAWFTFTK